MNIRKIYLSIFLQLIISLMILFTKTKMFLLCNFGFSIFLLPFAFIFINTTMIIYSIFIFLDILPQILPYTFAGKFIEHIIIINRTLLKIPSLLIIIFFLKKIYDKHKIVENLFDVLRSNEYYEKPENHSNLIEKALKTLCITATINKIEFGNLYSKYYLTIKNHINFNRFISLSPELNEIFKLKIRNLYDLSNFYLEIENNKKNKLSFKNFKYYIQPNKIMAMECSKKINIDGKINLLMHINENILHSIISSLFLSNMQMDFIISDNNESLKVYEKKMLIVPELDLDEIIKEMERRYRIIIPVAENIWQYNQNQKKYMNFLIIFYKANDNLQLESLSYILQTSEKVGIFIYLYTNDVKHCNQYVNFFSNIITCCVKDKSISYDLIGSSGAELLIENENDCIIKQGMLIRRINLPSITTEEQFNIINFI